MPRDLKDFKNALIDISEDYRSCLFTTIVMLEGTWLNTKEKRLRFAKELRNNKLDFIHHFINEEKRLQKDENCQKSKPL